jgi:hypothetical protein
MVRRRIRFRGEGIALDDDDDDEAATPRTEPVLPLRLMLGAAAAPPPTPPNTLRTDPLRDLVVDIFFDVAASVTEAPSASGAARGGSSSSDTKLSTRGTGMRVFGCFARRRCEGRESVD